MRILLVGGDGREHALAWKLSQSPGVEVLAVPGNPGTAACGRNLPGDGTSPEAVVALARSEAVDLVLVGDAAAQSAGTVDALTAAGIPVLGAPARTWALGRDRVGTKSFLQRHHIPTAPYYVCQGRAEAELFVEQHWTGAGLLLKGQDRLGMGWVRVAETLSEAQQHVADFFSGNEGARLVVETRLRGRELAIVSLVSGESVCPLPWVRLLTRRNVGDKGPVTPGMGAIAPAGRRDSDADLVMQDVLRATLAGLQAEGLGYQGFMTVHLLFTAAGPQVLDYHMGLGELEAEALLPVIDQELPVLLQAALDDRLGELAQVHGERTAVAVVAESAVAAGFEPVIEGFESVMALGNVVLFGQAWKQDGERFLATGDRPVACVGLARDLSSAQDAAYAGLRSLRIGGVPPYFRNDVCLVP